MGRRRIVNRDLPKGVQTVAVDGREYYFWAPGRGTRNAGQRVPLGSDKTDPRFWERLREARGLPKHRDGTLSALIVDFKKIKFVDDKRTGLRLATQRSYARFLDRLNAEGGDRPETDVEDRA